jgi:hypothetical protein
MSTQKKLRIGDWVEVRSKEEILQTLDDNGRLEEMTFMPEMFAFCGRRFRVYKSAHKTCDYSVYPYRTRRLGRTVHLETRCSGEAHDGCQAACLLYWKESWLKRVDCVEDSPIERTSTQHCESSKASPKLGCAESVVWARVKEPQTNDGTPTYICQMTQIHAATTPLAWWDIRQYVEDYFSGNVALGRILSGLIYWIYYSISEAGIGVGRPMRWLYDKFNPLWGGNHFPRHPGKIPMGMPTPLVTLNIQPGELVRVKSQEQILQTVDSGNRNRGMYWDAELVPYCGKTFKVLKRVTKLIGERTRKMQEMKNPCIILDSAICQARYSSCRMFCPKSMYPYWREIWLERIESPTSSSGPSATMEMDSAKQPCHQ